MLAIREMILRRLVTDLLAAKGRITIDSDRGYDPDAKSFEDSGGVRKATGTINAAVKEALEYDEVHIFVGPGNRDEGYGSYVYVIFGNGNCDLDMISDYSVSLEPVIEPIQQWIEGLQNGSVKLTTR